MNRKKLGMKYPVFICDDDPEQIELISKTLWTAEYILSDVEKVEFDVNSATNYGDALEYLKQNKNDGGIYFLDVELGKKADKDNGFDLAEAIKKQDKRSQIVFVTSHADLAFIAFERRLGSIDYIIKSSDVDVFKRRVVETIEVALHQLKNMNYIKKTTFTFKIGRQIFNEDMNNVIFIETTDVLHKLDLVKTNGLGQLIGTINQYDEENPLLVKISQSCLVNPENIESIDLKNRMVSFVNGDREVYSRSNVKKMKQLMQKYNYTVRSLKVDED